MAWWSFWYAGEVALAGISAKLWMARIEYIGIVSVPLGWVLFSLAYTERRKWLTRRNILLLSIIPVATILFVFSNDLHHLFYTSVALNENGPLSVLDASYGPLWYLYFVYAYIMLFSGTVLLFIRIFSIPKAYWLQQVLLILSPLLPWVANLLYLLRISPMPQLDLSPLAFTVSAFILGMDIFRFRLFDISPLARSTVINNMDIGMIVVDNQSRLVDINQAAAKLISQVRDDLWGQPVDDVLASFPELVARLASNEEVDKDIEISQGKTKLYYHIQINPIYDQANQQSGRLLLITDITRGRLTEEALILAQVRNDFLANISHELRTPINAVLGMAEMLSHEVYGAVNERQSKALGQIVDRSLHLSNLVDDLLEYVHREAGDFTLEIKEFSPNNLLESLQETVGDLASGKGLWVRTKVFPGLPSTILGDRTRLLQILLNLTENAIKFTEKGGVDIHLKTNKTGHWSIEVSDTGTGIPAVAQNQIFDIFKQADQSITKEVQGVGLGLAIVKQLVEKMDGTVSVEKTDKTGTNFVVLLPLLQPEVNSNEDSTRNTKLTF
ncbi:MAG: PAS domain-containing protein [Chloroflexi bacterium]|nr:PAS domain-containing protein [Chloroflexota bacterium]